MDKDNYLNDQIFRRYLLTFVEIFKETLENL